MSKTIIARVALAAIAASAAYVTGAQAEPARDPQFVNNDYPWDDPVLAYGEWAAGHNHFFINDDEDTEVIRFKTPRDIELCAAAGKKDGYRSDARGYPLLVKWDGSSSVIKAGNCMSFDAQSVSVRSAGRLPEGVVLKGSYRISK